MIQLIKRLINKEFIRFAIVGVFATVIHYGTYLLLKNLITVNIAYTAGYMISLVCNFILTAKFTFKTETSVGKGLGFLVSHGVNYLLHLGLLNLFLNLGLNKAFAPIPVYCIAIPINFILVRTVFKHLNM
jgi:putative flippase GtrA